MIRFSAAVDGEERCVTREKEQLCRRLDFYTDHDLSTIKELIMNPQNSQLPDGLKAQLALQKSGFKSCSCLSLTSH